MTGNVDIEKWLIVDQVPNLGPAGFARLLQWVDGDINHLFQQTHANLLQAGLDAEQIHALLNPDAVLLQKSLHWLNVNPLHFVLTIQDPLYPVALAQITRPPALLYGIGQLNLLSKSQLAIVGSRNPTVSAKEVAKRIAQQLAECGWVITSGLAIGIDGLAHRGALNADSATIAVLGTGIDIMYPRRHQRLAEEIIDKQGCILSEFSPGTPALAANFPRRNRIISGLSMGTLVVEAAIKSGSLITARLAAEQGREVFAIPGNINNPLVKGCHYLIKNGAKLVEDINDINEEFQTLSFMAKNNCEKKPEKSTEQGLATDKLLDSVDYEVTAIDVVTERSGLPLEVVTATLLEYELRGLVATVSGGYIKLGG
ncbi:DNA-processing protein DprA [Alteromonadaceae bacterium BrNp21-10]|nr:DNA-processing protein DprA [Alteromonadaceae bacterium BrNp21-10]